MVAPAEHASLKETDSRNTGFRAQQMPNNCEGDTMCKNAKNASQSEGPPLRMKTAGPRGPAAGGQRMASVKL